MADTETIRVKLVDSSAEKSIKIEYMGKTVSIGRKVLERFTDHADGTAVITIPGWLYRKEFE